MSGGLLGLKTLSDRTAQAALGAPPGRKGKDGVSIFDAFQTAGSASFKLVLSNGQEREIFLPPGAPGLDGITPTFTQGTIQAVPYGGVSSFALVPTATPGLYSYDVTLVRGPLPWAAAIPFAAGIVATPGPPATQVTYNKSTFVCTTAHTTTSTFDASKWICVAQGGADGNGNVSGTASSFDQEIIVANGAASTDIEGSGVKFGTGPGDAIRFDPATGRYPAGDGRMITGIIAVAAGVVSAYAGNVAPTGWLKCNGALVSRTTYAALFTAIGTTYGSGDGSTTFGLPDLRGEFVRGLDDGRGVDAGRTLGSAQADDFKSHAHGYNAPAGGTNGGTQATSAVATSSGALTGSAGGTETRPRNVALLYCIKF